MTVLYDQWISPPSEESILVNDFLADHGPSPQVHRLDSWRQPTDAFQRREVLVIRVVRSANPTHPAVAAIHDLRGWTRDSIRGITGVVGLHEQCYQYWRKNPQAGLRRDGGRSLLRLHATAKALFEVAGEDAVLAWWQNGVGYDDPVTVLENTGLDLVRQHLNLDDGAVPEFTDKDWEAAKTPNVDWEVEQMARDVRLVDLADQDSGAEEA